MSKHEFEGPINSSSYSPNIEIVSSVKHEVLSCPPYFRSRFSHIAGSIYNQGLIEEMRADDYNPYIIGYSHASLYELDPIKKKISSLTQLSNKTKILHEIYPDTLNSLRGIDINSKNFLHTEHFMMND